MRIEERAMGEGLFFDVRKLLMYVEMMYVSMFYFKMRCGQDGKSSGYFAVEL